MPNVSEQVGIRIKDYRLRAGLTQEGLAFNADIHVSFISEIERGLKKPSIESLEKLLCALNISFKDFFDFEIDVKTLKDSTALEKLVNELHNRSEREIELIYGLTKQILAFEDEK
jgi:transcriptional regulator with XRE-family HTH domain